uniref:Uncharacterized protein n=1 Tax=Cacopsylla melanoneura TaxID=428564 RepID=A0A8D8V144_9HEMI
MFHYCISEIKTVLQVILIEQQEKSSKKEFRKNSLLFFFISQDCKNYITSTNSLIFNHSLCCKVGLNYNTVFPNLRSRVYFQTLFYWLFSNQSYYHTNFRNKREN